MFNVYWGNRLIGNYPDERESEFKQFCNTNQISYQSYNDDNNYYLFPVLKGVTIALCPIDKQVGDVQKVVRNLTDQLRSWGALVMCLEDKTKYMKLIKMLKVHILLSLTENKQNSGKSGVKFFYSLKKKEESIEVIAAIAERLMCKKMELSYELANSYDFLSNLKYLKYYLADIPTVLIEINGLQELRQTEVEKVLLNGLVDKYGAINMEEQSTRVKSLVIYIDEVLDKEVLDKRKQDEKMLVEINKKESLDKDNEDINVIFNEQEVTLDNTKVEETPIKKKKNRKNIKPTLFPPGDGPVYQFKHPLKLEMYSNLPGYKAGESKNSCSQNTCSSFNLLNNDRHPRQMLDYEGFEKMEQSCRDLEELKDLSQKIIFRKGIENNS